MYHLQSNDGKHNFDGSTTFDQIVLNYHFDKKLRSIFSEYLERIEVCLRAKLTNYFSLNHGFFWYCDDELYVDKTVHTSINEEIASIYNEPQERFLKSFKAKYTLEIMPPSNMAMEVLTLGKLTNLFRGLANKEEKQNIASDFGLPPTVLSTWFIFLSIIRNICAHHGRLWNRKLTAYKPTIPNRKKFKFPGELPANFNQTVYGAISIIDRLLSNTNSTNNFTKKIEDLLNEFPHINTHYMGFPADWKDVAPWLEIIEEGTEDS